MTDALTTPRRYDEDDIARILKRATEIQIAEPSTAPASSGLTLDELEQIAVEAGIDPRHLRRAAQELESGSEEYSLAAKLVGSPLDIELEIVLPGELSADGFENLLGVIHQVTRQHGHASLVGHTLTWTSDARRQVMAMITVRGGRTQIRIEERLHGLVGGTFGVAMGGGAWLGTGVGMGIGWSVLGSAIFAAAFPVGVLGVAYIRARAFVRNRREARRKALCELMDRIVAEATASIAGVSVDPAAGAEALPGG